MKVYEKIAAVTAELSKIGISKDSKNTSQGYAFRGIDAVYGALSPMLSKHGLCILPRVTDRQVIERQNRQGTALFYVTLTVEFDFVAAEDGSKHTVITVGEAYKYAAFQAFCIPTEGDNDADAHTHEVSATDPAVEASVEAATTIEELNNVWKSLSAEQRKTHLPIFSTRKTQLSGK
jgi:hypothetical protein